MGKLIKNIRLFLYKRGYKKVTSTSDKIKRCLYYIDYINLYDRYYSNLDGTFVEKDIVHYAEELEKILVYPLDTKIVNIKVIIESSYSNKPYSQWYTYDGIILNDRKVLKFWLEKSLAFISWCDTAKKDFGNTYRLNNFRKLSPYYANIITIVDDIYFNLLKK